MDLLNGIERKTVVSLMGRENDRYLAPLREVESYWMALCGAEDLPLRSEIDPRGIEGALEFAFLIERISPRLAKLRVAGSHLTDLMGMEVAGMPLSALFAPEDRERLAEALESLFSDPAVLRITLRGESGVGKHPLEAELALFPLRSDMGEVSRALGCLVTKGRIGRTPRRFEISTVRVSPTPSGKLFPRQDQTTPPVAPAPRAMAEDAAPFTRPSPERPISGTPYLRVVVSNDD